MTDRLAPVQGIAQLSTTGVGNLAAGIAAAIALAIIAYLWWAHRR